MEQSWQSGGGNRRQVGELVIWDTHSGKCLHTHTWSRQSESVVAAGLESKRRRALISGGC